jgi:hypothetical protein
MDHNHLEATPTYVGIKNQDGELAVGADYKEALWRAKYLGFDRSPGAEPERCNVSPAQYHEWWNQRSDQERADMLQGGGSQPPAES